MNRSICTGLIILTAATTGWAASGNANRELALHRLSQAEDAAREMQDPAQKAYALAQIASLYAEAGDVKSAKDVASRLGRTDRARAILAVATTMAKRGEFAAAVALAHETKEEDQARLNQICAVGKIQAASDIGGARRLAAELPEPQRSRVLSAIAVQLALAGEVESAETTLNAVIKAEKRNALPYVEVAKALDGDLNAAAAKVGVSVEELPLNEFVRAALKVNNLGGAMRIEVMMASPLQRSSAGIDIAGWQIEHGRLADAQKELAAASAETEKIAADSAKTQRYLQIASLQIKTGNSAAALKTVRLAEATGARLEPALFESLGGKAAEVSLMVQAGALQEAQALATQPDGKILPAARPILASAYAAQGQPAEAEKLLSPQDPQADFEMYLAMARSAIQP